MEVVSFIPGRIRLRDEKLYRKREHAFLVESFMNDLMVTRRCRVNAEVGSVTIWYWTEEVDAETLKDKLRALIYSDTPYMHYVLEYHKDYLAEEKRLRGAQRSMMVFGGLYVIYKIKQLFFGKFFINKSLPVLQVAAAITIIKGYPGLNKLFKRYTSGIVKDPDHLLYAVGAFFTLVREGNKGTLLLFLKSYTDALLSYTRLQNIRALAQSGPESQRLMWIQNTDGPILVPLNVLQEGDEIWIYPSEEIPLEGTILQGEGRINSVGHSGEVAAVDKKEGDRVFPGMRLISGKLQVRITRLFQYEEKPDVNLKQLKLYKRVEEYQQRILPWAFALAGLSFMLTRSALAPLSVLLLMTPSAAKASVNAGLANYLRLLHKHGIVLRNIHTIEKIANTDTVVFDKTGTLTRGRLRISSVRLYGLGYTQNEILQMCASCESSISHPVALTLREAAASHGEAPSEVRYLPSKGVAGRYHGHEIMIGSKKLMEQEGIRMDPGEDSMEKKAGYLDIFVSVDRELAAIIHLVEEMEKTALSGIRDIKACGIEKVSLISGDRTENVERAARDLGIYEYQGDLDSVAKEQFIMAKKEMGTVMMIGDGNNDLEAMHAADVSVTCRMGASEGALAKADCILAEKHLEQIGQLLRLTHRSYGRIENNIRFSQHFNVVFGMLAVLGYIDPFTAKSTNTLNSIIAVLSSAAMGKITG